jgi:predicted nucleic acid-binding Zn ribbon protein
MPLYEYTCERERCGVTHACLRLAKDRNDEFNCRICGYICKRVVTVPGKLNGPTPKFHQRGKE